MKLLAGALAILMAVVLWTPQAAVAQVDAFLGLSASVGADRESGERAGHGSGLGGAGARASIMGLGVLPIERNWGLQGILHYVGGSGSRLGASVGPIYGWNGALPLVGGMGGKTGLFLNYQYRTQESDNFFWLRPSVAVYYGQSNVNLWYSQGLTDRREHDKRNSNGSHSRTDHAGDQLQASWSYFPTTDFGPYLRKDNWEFILGLQLTNMWTGGTSTGVGPVAGFSVMPMRNVVVNVVRLAADSESRYRVESGLQYVVSGKAATLKEMRRQYLEPASGIDAPGVVTVRTGCRFGSC